ncbi:MAG: MATE family efflux transporter [Candidatus Melainabacteria bacterium]|nr:MATE family efflux transporter [Candidatus Melainabacteria bacterium]
MTVSKTSDTLKEDKSSELITGNLWRAIWVMSWPLLIMTVATSLVGVADLYVAGSLGSATQAAVGLSEHIIFMFQLFLMATGTGTTAIVARHWGSGNKRRATRFAGQSLLLSISLGVGLTILAHFIAHFALGVFSQSTEVRELGQTYLSLYSFAMIPMSIVYVANAAFNAIGDSKTTLLIVLIMTAIQIAGDILTVIYGWPVPGLGLRGIALASLVGSAVGAVVALYKISQSPLRKCLVQILPMSQQMIKRIAVIGIPSAIQRMAWSLSVFGLFFILASCKNPTEGQAAWAIGMRVEGMLFMPIMALSMAVASIVGQNLGAREIDRAVDAGWRVTYVGMGMLTVMGILLYVMAEPIAMLMSHDPTTIKIVISYLKINATAQPFLALAMILSGALQGAADTKSPMYITFICNWLIRLPVAYLLALVLNMETAGCWWSMSLSCVVMGLLTAWRFKSLSWTKTHV